MGSEIEQASVGRQPHDSSNPRRVAIIGGGLSGLAAAHRLLELTPIQNVPIEISLFEASDRIGGVMGTQRIGKYLVETGADSFITNKPWAVNLCKRLGLADRLIPTDETFRRSLVLRKGKPLEVPDGFQLLAPVKIWPVLKSGIFSPWGKLRMAMEYFLPRRNSDNDESLASFVRRRFGNEVLERLVQPLVGGIYTSDPEQLSLKATLPRFLEMEREHRSLIRALRKSAAQTSQSDEHASGARYGLFTTPKGGISELLETLSERIRTQAKVHLNSPITSLHKERNQTWRLEFGDGSADTFDAVVIAVPAYQAAKLLQQTDQELSGMLGSIDYASSAIVVSGHKLSDIKHPMDAFGLVIPAIEKRRILAVSFTSRKFPDRAPDGCVQLRTFVGGAMQPEELKQTDQELANTVQQELADIFGITVEPDFSHIARWDNAMPQYHLGHLEKVEQIETRVKSHPALALAGNAFRGVGIPDCIHSGEQAAESVFGRLFDGIRNPCLDPS